MLLGWNAVFLAFVPLLLFYKKLKNVTLYLLVHSLLSTVIWFKGLQVIRYLAIYPALSLISGEVIYDLFNKKLFRRTMVLLLLITYVFSIVLWFGVFGPKMSYVFGFEKEAKDHSCKKSIQDLLLFWA